MLLLGDCNDWLKEIKDNSIDLLLTDPPYGIEFMGKDWDKALVSPETWKECYRVLKQGKLAFVMCSPRQDVLSRMIVNLQDAGFRTNYTSIYWTFASGFPKAANVSKLIDKKNGAVREVIGTYQYPTDQPKRRQLHGGYKPKNVYGDYEGFEGDSKITKSATEEAKKMEGAYVGFQPKPAVEVILVVSKGKTISWLDDCRIPYQSEDDHDYVVNGIQSRKVGGFHKWNILKVQEGDRKETVLAKSQNVPIRQANEKGRFPANLLVSDDVLNNGKITKSTGGEFKGGTDWRGYCQESGYDKIVNPTPYQKSIKPKDEGSYSRYFSLDSWWSKTFPFLICPKASKSERNKGCEDLPLVYREKAHITGHGWTQHKGNNPNLPRQNHHPTVKPLKLMSYLITMGSRKGDLILDPFCGSGTALIAADQLHRKWLGIERNPEICRDYKKEVDGSIGSTKVGSLDW